MIGMPHITVLMSTRNGAPYLRQQLTSLATQDHPHWSLWVSDDGSTDTTRADLRAFAKTRDNPVILLQGPQRGGAANTLNLLCHPDLPRGPVAFADQDDIWLPGHLSRGLAALGAETHPQGQAYVAHHLLLRAGQIPRALPFRTGRQPGFGNALAENILSGNSMMLDATAVALARRAGPVAVPFWDWWLYQLLTGAGARILRDATPRVLYRTHEANQLGPRGGGRRALWRMQQLVNGTYQSWVEINLAALETHNALLSPASRAVLKHLRTLAPAHRMRALSTCRHWPRDRLALWLASYANRPDPSRQIPVRAPL